MSHSQFHSTDLFILRHAWLNLWDKHMTTGRINQVSYKKLKGSEKRAFLQTTPTSPPTLYQKLCSLRTLTMHCCNVRFIARALNSLPSDETENKFPNSSEHYQAHDKNTNCIHYQFTGLQRPSIINAKQSNCNTEAFMVITCVMEPSPDF